MGWSNGCCWRYEQVLRHCITSQCYMTYWVTVFSYTHSVNTISHQSINLAGHWLKCFYNGRIVFRNNWFKENKGIPQNQELINITFS